MSKDQTSVYELCEAVESFIRSAEPEKRKALAAVWRAYKMDFPDDVDWAKSARAPLLLHELTWAFDDALRKTSQKSERHATGSVSALN